MAMISSPDTGEKGSPLVCADPLFSEYSRELDQIFAKYVESSSFYGAFIPVFQANQVIDFLSACGLNFNGRRVIDFGCGASRPTIASSIAYLLGAESCLAIDLDPPFDAASTALAQHALISALCSDRTQLNYKDIGRLLNDIQRRAGEFDLTALFHGDLLGGMPPLIEHRLALYQDLPGDLRRFDLLFSHSVFEHVSDLSAVLLAMRDSVNTGGRIFTNVDYRDHRCYSQGMHPWQYLVDDGDHTPGYINKLRHSEMVALMERTGWEITLCQPEMAPPPPEIRSAILQKYQDMSEDDLCIVSAAFLLKPLG